MSDNSFNTRKQLKVGSKEYEYFSLPAAEAAGVGSVSRLPMSLKILLENLLRFEDGNSVRKEDIKALGNWAEVPPPAEEIAYRPARVLMQDFTGVPGVADLSNAQRCRRAGLNPNIIVRCHRSISSSITR
jgi:aconitate hydratase